MAHKLLSQLFNNPLRVAFAGAFAFIALSCVPAAAQNISTVVGTGTSGFSGDNGPATSAQVTSPGTPVLDKAGNLYFVDSDNQRVRKVTASTGIITTVAGNGTAGFSGDGGPATSAQLNGPIAVAVDSAGNLYVSDYSNNRIRKVTASTGIITTVAGTGVFGANGDGGPATNAQLGIPQGLTVDSAGNIYISDTYNNRIRKITASTGIITTVAGDGTADYTCAIPTIITGPVNVALDSADNLYIADYGCGRIRKVDANTGIMSSVVGTGVQGFSGDGGLATNAQLQLPHGLVVDSVGNMYIADTANHRVRKVDASTGIITTIAGTGVQGFSGDGGPATDAQLYYPSDVSVDCAGNLFISDNGNRRIRKVAAAVPLCLPPVSAAVPVPSLSIPGLALLTLMLGAFAALRQRRA